MHVLHKVLKRAIEKNNLVIVTATQVNRTNSGVIPIKQPSDKKDFVVIDYTNLINDKL